MYAWFLCLAVYWSEEIPTCFEGVGASSKYGRSRAFLETLREGQGGRLIKSSKSRLGVCMHVCLMINVVRFLSLPTAREQSRGTPALADGACH